jgi:uncharacterized protein (DUF2249 family)
MDTPEIDVRDMAPRERHPRIFETLDGLGPGESFVLVNDHDPVPLRYHLEAGPEVWRVRLGRP